MTRRTFEQRHNNELLQMERDKEIVFGADRLAIIKGHEATPEEIQALANAVHALLGDTENIPNPIPVLHRSDIVGGDQSEVEPDETLTHSFGRKIRFLERPNQMPMQLLTNPMRMPDWGGGRYDKYPIQMLRVKSERKTFLRPRKGLMPGKYEVFENLYLDPENGLADVVKTFYPLYIGNIEAGRFLSAAKPATSTELDETMGILSESVRHSDELYENVR